MAVKSIAKELLVISGKLSLGRSHLFGVGMKKDLLVGRSEEVQLSCIRLGNQFSDLAGFLL